MNNYTVFHMEKMMTVSSVLERHITRKEIRYIGHRRVEIPYTPDNADPDLAFLNQEFVSRLRCDQATGKYRTLTISQAIKERLDAIGIKVRKGQNTAVEVLFSGSPEVMNNMDRSGIYEWAEATINWAENEWGKENIVAAVLHMDEKTPHIHMILVPIVQGQSRRSALQDKRNAESKKTVRRYNIDRNRPRLSVNDIFTQPLLYHYHTSYADNVGAKFGLLRGLKAEAGSKKRHQKSIDYNRELEREIQEKNMIMNSMRADYAQVSKDLAESTRKLEGNRRRLSGMTADALYTFMKSWEKEAMNKLRTLIESEYGLGPVIHMEEKSVKVNRAGEYALVSALKCDIECRGKLETIYVDLQDGGVYSEYGRPVLDGYYNTPICLESVNEYMNRSLSPEMADILNKKLSMPGTPIEDSDLVYSEGQSGRPKI